MTNKAYAVPLHELLAGIPRDTRLEITDPDGYGTRFIPVGRYCHEAAEVLRAALAQPEPEPVAWFTEDHREDKSATTYSKKMSERWREKGWPVTPLYIAPPQREWTDDEFIAEAVKRGHYTVEEKNNG
jgi:hypothetical protein